MVLAFHGLECLREHVKTGSRIHYTILEGTGAANIVHPKARARITCRSADKTYLEDMLRRMRLVVEGSAMMTETQVKVTHDPMFYDTIINMALHNAVEENAALLDVKKLVHKTEAQINVTGGGATDYGNVSYVCPGVMFYVEYGDNVVAHTPEYVALGKTEEASNYLKNCAKIMAGVSYDFINDEEFAKNVKDEYLRRLREKGIEA
jgi:metal-dependent amidase/aminoacylase/carboxypeptidase family protein